VLFFYPVMCPKGDDPLTLNQQNRKLRLTVSSSSQSLQGFVGLQFAGVTAWIAVGESSASSSSCKASLEASGRFQSVVCTYSSSSSFQRIFDVEVLAWPIQPGFNNLYSHNGNPGLADFFCDISQSNSDAVCHFTDLVSSNLVGTNIFRSYLYVMFTYKTLMCAFTFSFFCNAWPF
jgi:hypothetical protein